jgi:DNA gyrase/topoisomerase IV subunit B
MTGMADGLRGFARKECVGFRSRRLIEALSIGLKAIVCVRLSNARYEGPVRDKLITPEVEATMKTLVANAFPDFLRQNENLVGRVFSYLGK